MHGSRNARSVALMSPCQISVTAQLPNANAPPERAAEQFALHRARCYKHVTGDVARLPVLTRCQMGPSNENFMDTTRYRFLEWDPKHRLTITIFPSLHKDSVYDITGDETAHA